MMRSLPTNWKWVLGILVALNIVSLVLLWMRPVPPGGVHPRSAEDMAAFFKKELGLDEAQKDAFAEMLKKHGNAVRQLHEAKRRQKDAMFDAMTTSPQDSALVVSLAEKAASTDKELDLLLAAHFRDLQAICEGQQREKLGQLFKESIPKPPLPHGKRPNR